MASLNKVMVIGGLGRDPEVSYTPAGSCIAKISVATSETRKDKQTGEKKEKTEWHRVTFFGPQAETIGKYMVKGKQIYVEGRLQTSSYEKDGVTRYSTDIIASNFQFIGSKSDNQQQSQQQPAPNNFQDNGTAQNNNGFPNNGGGSGFQNNQQQNNGGFNQF